jgi:hypothetical protein
MKKLIYALLVLFAMSGFQSSAQSRYSAYTDIQNRFYVFENNENIFLEPLPPKSYKIGKAGLAYLDNIGIFKVFRDGNNNVINNNITLDYGVTDNLIYYISGNALNIIDGMDDKQICRFVGEYAVGDSVVFYFDKMRNTLQVYYNGKSQELENNLANTDFSNVVVSDNVVAYTNFTNQFKVFWQGQTYTLETQDVTNIKVGRNTVAYTDINGQFKVWQSGEQKYFEAFTPKTYQVGDDVVAFNSYDGSFKIFYNGELNNIGFFEKNYKVSDWMVVYQDGNDWMKLFHKGQTTTVDNYYANAFLAHYNSFAYINKANILRVYTDGDFKDASTMVRNMEDVQLDFDVVRYKIGLNMYKFHVNGQEF